MKKNISIQIYSSDLEEFREYLYERENSQATIKKYLSDFKIFCEFLGEETNIYKGTLLSYKEWLVAHYAISSVNSMLVSLNQYLTYKDAPGLKIKRIKVQKQLFIKEEKALTKAEYFRLIDTARKKKKEQLALIIETIGATGIRISELSGFTLEQIRKGRVEIYNKGKNRIILIPSQLKKKLLRYADSQKIRNGCLFITRNGKPKDRSNLWAEMKKLHADAGVAKDKIFPHNLRHMFARCYYKMTKDLTGLADLLGHSSLETTRIYTSEAGCEFQKKIERLKLVY